VVSAPSPHQIAGGLPYLRHSAHESPIFLAEYASSLPEPEAAVVEAPDNDGGLTIAGGEMEVGEQEPLEHP
jgi:hypothetical protein